MAQRKMGLTPAQRRAIQLNIAREAQRNPEFKKKVDLLIEQKRQELNNEKQL